MSQSRRQIFQSTALIGGSQAISLGFGLLKNKLLAVLLGPAGVGLAGLYASIPALVGSLSVLGIPVSGVRQIADSAAKNNERRIATTVSALKTLTWAGGLTGMCGIIAFASPISQLTFGDPDHAVGIRIVATVVLIEGFGARQRAILQGMRRIKELSLCQVLGAIGGTVIALPFIIVLREQGVPWFLMMASFCTVIASWWFARQVPIERITLTIKDLFTELKGLLSIGIAVVVTGFIGAAIFYLTRLLITNRFNLDTVGLYQAACALSLTFSGMVLGAMGTDYYPRLAAVAEDHVTCNRLINEQAEMGMLIMFPGLLATLVLAPWILKIVYSSAFTAATDVIRWQILGDALKVVSWPLGFIALAKGRGGVFMLVEGSCAIIQLAIFYLCIQWWRFEGSGIAFFIFYGFYTALIVLVARRLTSFSWEKSSRKTMFIIITATAAIFLLCRYTSPSVSLSVGVAGTLLATWWSYLKLKESLGGDYFENISCKLIGLFQRDPQTEIPALPPIIARDIIRPNLAKAYSSKEEFGYLHHGNQHVYFAFHRANKPVAQVLLAGHFAVERPFSYAPWVRWARYLAEQGFSALRFDYRGCGESTGRFQDYTLKSWIEDCMNSCAYLREQAPDVPLILNGIGLGGLIIAHSFKTGLGDGMLLWSPSQCGSSALRDTFFKRMAFDLANSETGQVKTWAHYKSSLEQGIAIDAAGYTITPALWREAEEMTLVLPESGGKDGIDDHGRPWKVTKLSQSEVPLIAGGGLWQALNPGLRIHRAPLNPDMHDFFKANTQWISSNVNRSTRHL
ncbi:MAG: oligosaccharide flippase family protein [bacterium]